MLRFIFPIVLIACTAVAAAAQGAPQPIPPEEEAALLNDLVHKFGPRCKRYPEACLWAAKEALTEAAKDLSPRRPTPHCIDRHGWLRPC